MLSVKEAAAKAAEYFKDFYGSRFGNVMLEEVEQHLEADGKYWYITLGYDVPPQALSELFRQGSKLPREYKIFKIDGSTGEVLSMKIREVAAVE
jgi:hypothetical protein